MSDLAAVFIDGGYLARISKDHFGQPRIDFSALSKWSAEGYGLLRTYYYDCPPYQSSHATQEERERLAARQRFHVSLNRLDRFTVRCGRLEYRGQDAKGEAIFQQKRVDLQLGLDIASLVTKDRIGLVILVSGDSDMIPAVEMAKNQGILVRLVHGPTNTYHKDLWDIVDERKEITAEVIKGMLL